MVDLAVELAIESSGPIESDRVFPTSLVLRDTTGPAPG
jgi:hypothetical protein